MTLREEVDVIFFEATKTIAKRTTPPGIMRHENGPDERMIIINENFASMQEAIRLIADRVDGTEGEDGTIMGGGIEGPFDRPFDNK